MLRLQVNGILLKIPGTDNIFGQYNHTILELTAALKH